MTLNEALSAQELEQAWQAAVNDAASGLSSTEVTRYNILVDNFGTALNLSKLPETEASLPNEDIVPFFDALFTEHGFDRKSNPFLLYLDIQRGTIDFNQFVDLYNLVASGALTTNDVKGTGPNRMSHVIFNQQFKDAVKEDEKFIFTIQAYQWLEKASNLSAYAKAKTFEVRDEADPSHVSFSVNLDDAKRSLSDRIALRDWIIFDKGITSGKTNDADKIQEYLNQLEQPAEDDKGNYNTNPESETVHIEVSSRATKDWASAGDVDVSRLSKEDVRDLMAYLVTRM